MEDQFYRSIQPHHLGKRLLKKALKNKKKSALILLGSLLFFYVLFDNKGIIARVRLESQHKEVLRQLKADSLETVRLQAQIKALEEDKKTVEKIAREKYVMAREGETVYRVKKD